jgi:hypothetical protein
VRRIRGQNLADDKPVEQHANCGQMQFDGPLGGRRLQHLHIGGDVDRLDVGELADLVLLDPGKEVPRDQRSYHHPIYQLEPPHRILPWIAS